VDYRDHHGKRHRPLFETEQLALGRAAELSNTLAQALLVDDPDLTLSTYVTRWLAGAQEIEVKTLASYRQLLTQHVLPILGPLKLRELHRRHVKTLLVAKRMERLPPKLPSIVDLNDYEPRPMVGYSKNTVRLIKAALSSVLSDAVDDGPMPAYCWLMERPSPTSRLSWATPVPRPRCGITPAGCQAKGGGG
jgi:Phage integrase, N-terminal SAM-like domain